MAIYLGDAVSGNKRSFGDIEDDEDDIFGSKKVPLCVWCTGVSIRHSISVQFWAGCRYACSYFCVAESARHKFQFLEACESAGGRAVLTLKLLAKYKYFSLHWSNLILSKRRKASMLARAWAFGHVLYVNRCSLQNIYLCSLLALWFVGSVLGYNDH